MASITYESFLPDILPFVQGCSDTLITNTVRATTIDFCERTGVYQQELDPVTTVKGIYEYDLEAPSQTLVHKIMWVVHKGLELEAITSSLLEQRYPMWRDNNGTPTVYSKVSQGIFHLIPIPSANTTSSTILRVQLKPTYTSQSCEAEIMNDYHDAIVNGALFRLSRIPNRDWTDLNAAGIYSNLYNQGVSDGERRARGADERIARKVSYDGVHSRRKTGKYANKRVFSSSSI